MTKERGGTNVFYMHIDGHRQMDLCEFKASLIYKS